MSSKGSGDRIGLVLSMCIFGTIGIVRRYIPYSSAMVAFFRGAIASVVLIMIHLLRRRRLDRAMIRENIWLLLGSGALIGIDWIVLFEAYRHTSVSVATVCYYMAPIFTIIASPIVLHEGITLKKALCAVFAMLGMVLVSGVLETGVTGMKGVLIGLASALLYAVIVLMNKKLSGLDAIDRTLFQMWPAALAVLPYWLLTDSPKAVSMDARGILLLLEVGTLNTALPYILYLGSLSTVPAQTAALFSYIDPAIALLLSALILSERMSVLGIAGVMLVFGSAMASEMNLGAFGRKAGKRSPA